MQGFGLTTKRFVVKLALSLDGLAAICCWRFTLDASSAPTVRPGPARLPPRDRRHRPGGGHAGHGRRDRIVLLIDSSVWIEVLRGDMSLEEVPQSPGTWATTEPMMLEVLAGAVRFEEVRSRLDTLPLRSVEPSIDYLKAAGLFRATRQRGLSIRSLTDCLIAAIACGARTRSRIRDADFEALKQVRDLRTMDLRRGPVLG